MGYIYKISNDVNDKIYIGQTSRSIHKRKVDYWYEVEHYEGTVLDRPINKAMRKYGMDKFHMKVIEEVDNDRLDEREIYWIEYYDSYHNGYNATIGGGGRRQINKNPIYLELWNKGLNLTEIAEKQKCDRHTVKRHLQLFGITESDFEKRLSESVGRKRSKGVIQLKNNKIIAEYNSMKEASEATGILVSGISSACSGKRLTAGGYEWRKKNA